MSRSGISTRRARSGGFTLHQLLCVLALIPITVMLMVALIGKVNSRPSIVVAKKRVSLLDDAVNTYMVDIGRCPTTRQGFDALLRAPADLADKQRWKGPYLDVPQVPLDPWNNPYWYEADSDTRFVIWSVGPDGQFGTLDDISNDL